MKAKDLMKYIKLSINIILWTICIYFFAITVATNINYSWLYKYSNDLAVDQCLNHISFEYERPKTTPTKQQIIKKVEGEIGCFLYTYNEDAPINGGWCSILFRVISVNAKNLPLFTTILAHEMTHLTYITKNEIYANFMAFKVLYESEDEWLRYCGLYHAKRVLNGYFDKEYDCSYYIIKYFNSMGVN